MALLVVLAVNFMGLATLHIIFDKFQKRDPEIPLLDGCEEPVSYEYTDPLGKDLSTLGNEVMKQSRSLKL